MTSFAEDGNECPRMRAARAARLFFLIQPIMLLICLLISQLRSTALNESVSFAGILVTFGSL